MAKWKHRATKHKTIGEYFFQVNTPVDHNIPEFEVVVFKNGVVIEKVIGWDSYDSHDEMIKKIHDGYANDDSDAMSEEWASYHYQ